MGYRNSYIFVQDYLFFGYESYEQAKEIALAFKYAGLTSEIVHESTECEDKENQRPSKYSSDGRHVHVFPVY